MVQGTARDSRKNMESPRGEGEKEVARIGIRTTIYFPEAPSNVEMATGTSLGDALWR
jgi:hypothetical protein